MICVNCGKAISGKICECCGTDYRTDEEKNKPQCDHIYNEYRIMSYDIEHCYYNLAFKCCKCNAVLTIHTTELGLR